MEVAPSPGKYIVLQYNETTWWISIPEVKLGSLLLFLVSPLPSAWPFLLPLWAAKYTCFSCLLSTYEFELQTFPFLMVEEYYIAFEIGGESGNNEVKSDEGKIK